LKAFALAVLMLSWIVMGNVVATARVVVAAAGAPPIMSHVRVILVKRNSM